MSGGRRRAAAPGPVGRWLADAPVSRKVWMLLAAPLVAVLLASAPAAWSATSAVGQAGQLQAIGVLDRASSVLSAHLHVVQVRLASESADPASRTAVPADLHRAATLRAEFDTAQSAVSAPSAAMRRAFGDAGRALDAVDGVAAQVRAGTPVVLSAMLLPVREAIVALAAVRDVSAQSSPDPVLGDAMHAAAALSRAREAIGREQLLVVQAYAAGRMSPASAQAVITARADAAAALDVFTRLGPPQWRQRLTAVQADADVVAAMRLSGMVPLSAGPLPALPGGTAGWNAAMQGWADQLGELEAAVDGDIAASAGAMQASASWSVVAVSGAVLLAVVVALLLTVVVARSLTGRLQRLQAAARQVADQELPTLISRIIAAEDLDTAARLAGEALRASAMPHTDRDEIGVLAQVVDRLVQAAADAATSQVEYRLRMLALVHTIGGQVDAGTKRMFNLLDRYEKGEADPVQLGRYFALDFEAAQLSRFAMNLWVLAGGVPMLQRDAAPLDDVIVGALAKVRDYERIVTGQVAAVRITPGAVLAVLHVLVELLDNATGYSPPEKQVWVKATTVGDRVRINVEDDGIEVSDARLGELNAKLLRPPVDVGNAGRIGLLVVARLARTHGIGVVLHRKRHGGLTAVVDLPPDILLPAGPDRYPAITDPPSLVSMPRQPAHGAAERDTQPSPHAALPAAADRARTGVLVAAGAVVGGSGLLPAAAAIEAAPMAGGDVSQRGLVDGGLPKRRPDRHAGGMEAVDSAAVVERDVGRVKAQISAVTATMRATRPARRTQ